MNRLSIQLSLTNSESIFFLSLRKEKKLPIYQVGSMKSEVGIMNGGIKPCELQIANCLLQIAY